MNEKWPRKEKVSATLHDRDHDEKCDQPSAFRFALDAVLLICSEPEKCRAAKWSKTKYRFQQKY
jgi:hypothetical protein